MSCAPPTRLGSARRTALFPLLVKDINSRGSDGLGEGFAVHELAIVSDLGDVYSDVYPNLYGVLVWRDEADLPEHDPDQPGGDIHYQTYLAGKPVPDALRCRSAVPCWSPPSDIGRLSIAALTFLPAFLPNGARRGRMDRARMLRFAPRGRASPAPLWTVLDVTGQGPETFDP